MKVLITGGCGFLGSNLASSFLADGDEVVVIDSLFRKGSAFNLHWLESQSTGNQFTFIQADIAEKEVIRSIFRRYAPFDYVCHVAGQVAMTTSLLDPYRDLQTNVLGTFNILEAVREYCSEALVSYSSTNKVYGDLEWINTVESDTRYVLPDYPGGFDELLQLDFSTPYGCSKGAADQYVRDWSRVYGLKTVVFRHSSIYGGRQYASFDQGWIGWFCQQALYQQECRRTGSTIEPFTIAGTGKQVRDVLHASDLVRLYKLAFLTKDTASGHVFNIGGGFGNSLSLLELFTLLSKLLDSPPLVFTRTPRRASDQDCFIASIAKAEQIMGWSPQVSCEDGIRAMLNWCKESGSVA
jgi:CDP-paratose 2-epimerase